ncbi:MAG: hypothetical protein OXC68_04085 [Aestuariivita sp.]|nr:hypothetical protein [Aestuariivita sp.]
MTNLPKNEIGFNEKRLTALLAAMNYDKWTLGLSQQESARLPGTMQQMQ